MTHTTNIRDRRYGKKLLDGGPDYRRLRDKQADGIHAPRPQVQPTSAGPEDGAAGQPPVLRVGDAEVVGHRDRNLHILRGSHARLADKWLR